MRRSAAWLTALILLAGCTSSQPGSAPRTWALMYENGAPAAEFLRYDLVAFDSFRHPELSVLKDGKRVLLGYISFGESAPHLDTDWVAREHNIILRENTIWKSQIIDIRSKAWRDDILNRQIPFILSKGFDGLMVDTIESVTQLERENPKRYGGMKAATLQLLRDIKARYPAMPICLNRAFDLYPEAKDYAGYFLAESTYTSYDFSKKQPFNLSEAERTENQRQLATLRAHGITILSVDYWPPTDTAKIKEIYAAQRRMGNIPYVSTVDLKRHYAEPQNL